MRVLIWGAFVLAMIPLVSLIWSVLSNGLGRFDLYFLTHSMRNVYGGMDAGGVYHALLGTLLITGLATLISVPIGILTAVYLVEYGSGHAGARRDVPRRRHDGHPVDRRRSVRVRALLPAGRAGARRAASWARSRCRC